MKKVLITGASGFAGPYTATAFETAGYDVVRAGHGPHPLDLSLDLTDGDNVRAAVAAVRPEIVVHLAAQSFVPAAAADPPATYDLNVMGTARLTEALRALRSPVRCIVASSAEVYGLQALTHLPLREDLPLRPANAYAASKAAAEMLALASRSEDLHVVIARPFNHIGPGQDPRFAVAGFVQQLAAIAAGAPATLDVGNLHAERDFLDVRDVAAAYVALAQSGLDGESYNIASGRAVAISEVLRRCIMLAGIPVQVRNDPARMRASEIPKFYGDATKLRTATGWNPRIDLEASLQTMLAAATAPAAAG